jgi:hypothetical protein
LESISSITQSPLNTAFNSSTSIALTSSTTSLANTANMIKSNNIDSSKPDTDNLININDNKKIITDIKNETSTNETKISDNNNVNNMNSNRSSSRRSSISSSSSLISIRSSSSERSHSSTSRSRSSKRERSMSTSTKSSAEYSDYANDYDSEEDSNCEFNSKLTSDNSENMTVNDMLLHVISFAMLSIKVTLKNQFDTKISPQSQINKNEDLIKQDNQSTLTSSNQQQQHIHPQHQYQQIRTNLTQQQSNPLQTLIQSMQSKQFTDNQQQLQQQVFGSIASSSAATLQNLGLFNQNLKQSDEMFKKMNELLLPMLIMSNAQSPSSTNSNIIKYVNQFDLQKLFNTSII